jgi:hypothetical protein
MAPAMGNAMGAAESCANDMDDLQARLAALSDGPSYAPAPAKST